MLIRIKKLRLRTIIGVYEWEQNTLQEVWVNLELEVEDESSTFSDDLNDSVDYKVIKDQIIKMSQDRTFALCEKLAGSILELVMRDERISRAKVEVDKPGALRFTDSVSIVLEKTRGE